jgi:TetR/AcrR family transcriptional regulator, regulator of cefoperazone and chloramphenicol sensitivity
MASLQTKSRAAKTPAPRKRDREATGQALLEAAKCVFAKHGYDAATTKEIAVKAKVNEALIQRYFGGKAGLLEAILKQGRAPCSGGYMTNQNTSLKDVIASFFHRNCGETEQNEEFMKVVVSRAVLDPHMGKILKERVSNPSQEYILKALKPLQESGKISKDIKLDRLAYALSSLAFSLGFFGRLVHRNSENFINETIEEITGLLTRALEKK